MPHDACLTDGLRSLLRALLVKDPHLRISSADAAKHSWLKGCLVQQPISRLVRHLQPAAEQRRYFQGQVRNMLSRHSDLAVLRWCLTADLVRRCSVGRDSKSHTHLLLRMEW